MDVDWNGTKDKQSNLLINTAAYLWSQVSEQPFFLLQYPNQDLSLAASDALWKLNI